MTSVARIGRADLHREVRPRHAEAVVGPRVDHHVILRGHVAARALRAGAARRMVVMRFGVVVLPRQRRKARVAGRLVASRAQRIAVGPQAEPMRVVAIGAAHALRVHPALQERAPDVDLVLLLAVGVVEALAQQRRMIVVEERLARKFGVGEPLAPRMARRAGFDLITRIVAAEIDDKAERVRVEPFGILARRGLRPRDVRATGAVAGLAADVHFRPLGVVRVRLRVVVTPQVRRMALGAHQVPVLVAPGRVQRIVGRVAVVGIEREPALLLRVPRDRRRLQASAGKFDQVLLQRRDAERVLDLELGGFAVAAFHRDVVLAVALGERRGRALVRELRVREVAQHRLRAREFHRALVVRAAPRFNGFRVAFAALRVRDVGAGDGGLRRRRRCRRRGGALRRQPHPGAGAGRRDAEQRHDEQRPAHRRGSRRGGSGRSGFFVPLTTHGIPDSARDAERFASSRV